MDKSGLLDLVKEMGTGVGRGAQILGFLVEEIYALKFAVEKEDRDSVYVVACRTKSLEDVVADLQSRMPSALKSQLGSIISRVDRLEKALGFSDALDKEALVHRVARLEEEITPEAMADGRRLCDRVADLEDVSNGK